MNVLIEVQKKCLFSRAFECNKKELYKYYSTKKNNSWKKYLNATHAIKAVSPYLLACFHLPVSEKKNNSSPYKKMWYLRKNSLAVKKVRAALFKNSQCEKSCESKGWPRNGCDSIHRLMTKILITTIQVNFVLISSETGVRQHKLTWIVVIICHQPIPSQPFIGHPLWVHNFFHTVYFWTGPCLFLQPGCFWVDIVFCKQ